MESPEISIIVATFNEQETIAPCLRRILATLPQGCEVLVIDGGTDDTKAEVLRIARTNDSVRYVRNENDRGKGHAIGRGIVLARGNIMAQIDSDLQFRPEELPRLLDPIRKDLADVVLGSRFMDGSIRYPGSTPIFRTLGNKSASLYASLLFWHRMTDVQAGIKAWSRQAAQAINLKSDNYSYEVEIAVKALRAGLRVVDVPVSTEARQGGDSCVNVVSDGFVLLWDITRFRLGLK